MRRRVLDDVMSGPCVYPACAPRPPLTLDVGAVGVFKSSVGSSPAPAYTQLRVQRAMLAMRARAHTHASHASAREHTC
jgi:hypothetical protein